MEFINVKMVLNEFGEIVNEELKKSIEIRKEIKLDEYVIMPNHFHCIVFIEDVGVNGSLPPNKSGKIYRANCHLPLRANRNDYPTQSDKRGSPSKSLNSFVQGFKAAVTNKIKISSNLHYPKTWQRNYYERVIRDESELNSIREYIQNNPKNWEGDENNPMNWV